MTEAVYMQPVYHSDYNFVVAKMRQTVISQLFILRTDWNLQMLADSITILFCPLISIVESKVKLVHRSESI